MWPKESHFIQKVNWSDPSFIPKLIAQVKKWDPPLKRRGRGGLIKKARPLYSISFVSTVISHRKKNQKPNFQFRSQGGERDPPRKGGTEGGLDFLDCTSHTILGVKQHNPEQSKVNPTFLVRVRPGYRQVRISRPAWKGGIEGGWDFLDCTSPTYFGVKEHNPGEK